MKHPFQKAYDELKAIGAPVFERSDHPDRFLLSAEDNGDEKYQNRTWADYWQIGMPNRESNLDDFGVDKGVSSITDSHGIFLEWETPGCLIAYI